MLTVRNDVADIATLDTGIPPAVHKAIRLIEMAFIVDGTRTGLMVHNHLHPLLLGITADFLYIKIWIWRNKIKDIVLLFAKPVLPTFVPPLDQNGIKAMLARKVNIVFDMLRIGSMPAITPEALIVSLAQLHAIHIISIRPSGRPLNHFPPHTDIFYRFNPACILNPTRLVEIESDTARQNISPRTPYDYRTPRAVARGL